MPRSPAVRRASRVRPAERLELGEIEVPGDFSSAAPFIVAATLVPGSELHIHGVNLNPRRTGLLTILERMGGRITVYNRRRIAGEPAGDLEIRSAELVATTVLGGRGPARDRRAAALCARGLLRARQQPPARGGGAAREGIRPRRGDGDSPARSRPARDRDRGRVSDPRRPGAPARWPDPESRRPPDRDARSDRRPRLAARASRSRTQSASQ